MAKKNASRRFEFKDAKSEKFWAISLDGAAHTVVYGRIGTSGQTKTKDFPDDEAAKKSYEKLIGQKTKKGYEEVVAAAPPSKADLAAQREFAKKFAPFKKAILADPNDIANYSVFGDWLCDQGSPLGDFVGVQIALEDESLKAPARKKLKTQEKSLLKKHEREWLGSLAEFLIDQKGYDSSWGPKKCYEYNFARGFLDTITTEQFSLEFGHALAKSPYCETLRQLAISDTDYLEEPVTIGKKTYEADEDYGLDTLKGAKFSSLKHFRIGRIGESNCHTHGEGAAPLVKKMPFIESLHFEARGIETEVLFKIKMPHLKSLVVHHLHDDYPLELLAKNSSLKNLETLQMHPHAMEYDDDCGAYLRFEHIKAIGRSKHLTSLKHLQFRLSNMGDAGVEEIIKSGLLGRLKTLDVMHGCITDEGVDMLIASPDLQNLEMLLIDGNAITNAGVTKLKKSGVKHSAKSMIGPEGVEEGEYLWHGDIE